MPSPVHNAMKTAKAAILKLRGDDITYTRGAASVGLKARPGTTPFRIDTEAAFGVLHRARDWIVNRDALKLAGQRIEPQVGDIITHHDGTTTHTYQVAQINGEPCWRYSDTAEAEIRIHTQHTAEA